MLNETIADAIRAVFDDPVLIDDHLFYHTTTDDKTKVRRPLDRPRDIDGEVWQLLINRLPPELTREVRRAEVIAYLRSVATVNDTPMPWDVLPNPDAIGMYRDSDHIGDCYKFNEAGPSLVRAVISAVMARHDRPRTRAPVLIVLSRRDQWPALMTTLHNLCAGRVQEDGPGHGQPSPGCLVSVYHHPPQDDDARGRFWTEARGDRRRPVPVPVVLAEWQSWQSWQSWLMSGRAAESMPPAWMYFAPLDGEAQAAELRVCSKCWAGAQAVRAAGQAIAERLPKTSLPTEGAYAHVNNVIRQAVVFLVDREAEIDPSPGSCASDPPDG